MDTSTSQSVAQRLYDRAEITFLEQDRAQLNGWADSPGVLDVLMDQHGPVDFTNMGVGRGRGLWILISERRPDLLVGFLAKVAEQAMMVPHNAIKPDTLLDPSVRKPLVEWLRHGPEPDPVLGLLQAKEVCLLVLDDKVDVNDAQWAATLAELTSTFSLPQQQSQMLMWLGETYHARLRSGRNTHTIEQNSAAVLQTLIDAGLDLGKPVEHESVVNGTRGVKAKNPSTLHGLGHLYAENNFTGDVLLDVALRHGPKLSELLDNAQATPQAIDGLRHHPTIRRELLQDYAEPARHANGAKRRSL